MASERPSNANEKPLGALSRALQRLLKGKYFLMRSNALNKPLEACAKASQRLLKENKIRLASALKQPLEGLSKAFRRP